MREYERSTIEEASDYQFTAAEGGATFATQKILAHISILGLAFGYNSRCGTERNAVFVCASALLQYGVCDIGARDRSSPTVGDSDGVGSECSG